MRQLRITEVLSLKSSAIVPPFTEPAQLVTVRWPWAVITLIWQGAGYLIKWDGGSQLVPMRENPFDHYFRFICPFCDKVSGNLYFDGDKWGCPDCLNLRKHKNETGELIQTLSNLL